MSKLLHRIKGSKPFGIFVKLRGSAVLTMATLLVLTVAAGFFSLRLAASGYGEEMYRSYWTSALLIFLNFLPPVILVFALYFATGRAWIAFGAGVGFLLILSGIDFYKIIIRGDPLFISDVAFAGEAGDILERYTIELRPEITNAAIFGLCSFVWVLLTCGYRFRGARLRLVASLVSFAVLLGLSATVYMNDRLYIKTVGDYDNDWPTAGEAYIMRGFVYPFIHNIGGAFPTPPDGYSKEAARAILAKYPSDEIPEEQRVNVISIMLEAFCDLSMYPGTGINEHVYDKWHELQKESVHGNLIVNIFAGGTVNTERLFLTGDTSLSEISSARESYVYYFRDNRYYTEGLHTGFRWYYNRQNICADLGFQNYYFHGDFHETDRSDELFFSALTTLYERRDKSVPYFSHSLTFQNHGGYESGYTTEPYMLERGELSEESFNIVNNYLTGIDDTVERIWSFVDSLRDDPEPVILLLYGDHKPWLGDSESVYREFGILSDRRAQEELQHLYTTPYIIWANDAAKTVLGRDFVGEGGDFSPTYLMNRMFDLAGWGGDSYMKAANAAFADTPIVNANSEMTPALEELCIVEFYRRRNFTHTHMTRGKD